MAAKSTPCAMQIHFPTCCGKSSSIIPQRVSLPEGRLRRVMLVAHPTTPATVNLLKVTTGTLRLPPSPSKSHSPSAIMSGHAHSGVTQTLIPQECESPETVPFSGQGRSACSFMVPIRQGLSRDTKACHLSSTHIPASATVQEQPYLFLMSGSINSANMPTLAAAPQTQESKILRCQVWLTV